jgi:hypothetical protein
MLTYNANIAGQAAGRLLAQFKNKPLITGLLAVHAKQFQDLEDALWTILNGRPFPAAGGDALTRWGQTVGQLRPKTGTASTDDTVYKPQVQARIFTNTSNGKAEDIMRILRVLGAVAVQYSEPAPASVLVEIQDPITADDPTLMGFLVQATGPINLHANIFTSHPFGFAADPTSFGFDDGELGRTIA